MRKVYRDGLPYIYEEDHLAALEAAVKEKDRFLASKEKALDHNEKTIIKLDEQITALKGELKGEKKWSETLHGHLLAQIEEKKKMLLSFQEHFAALKGRQAEAIKRLQRKHHPVCSCKQCMGLKEDPYPPDALKQGEATHE